MDSRKNGADIRNMICIKKYIAQVNGIYSTVQSAEYRITHDEVYK